ncbi:hypothetical protein IC620_02575 [Hazenella sp. IB182357]|uniref:Uncharacterized protein n=1 Tax=Polycladospora coralii TaxID=2771432 RepID=A0A926N7R2_9BACL|nr:hypothetical protein [Polycladospora coralii]MBD1371242.1 hypothetical protein [Polycladospora coralii]MBS7530184.1 hypothetical protein [Polycladospora coralii]
MFGFNKQSDQERNRNQNQDIEELMNEVGSELGVDEDTRSLDQDPEQFAERLKQAIKKRTT